MALKNNNKNTPHPVVNSTLSTNETEDIIVAELEEKMGEEILKAMAYPSGKCSENSKAWLKEAGFEVQVLTKYGTVNKSRTLDLTDLGRIRGEQATGTQLLKTITNASV